jgi:hypothetical protein
LRTAGCLPLVLQRKDTIHSRMQHDHMRHGLSVKCGVLALRKRSQSKQCAVSGGAELAVAYCCIVSVLFVRAWNMLLPKWAPTCAAVRLPAAQTSMGQSSAAGVHVIICAASPSCLCVLYSVPEDGSLHALHSAIERGIRRASSGAHAVALCYTVVSVLVGCGDRSPIASFVNFRSLECHPCTDFVGILCVATLNATPTRDHRFNFDPRAMQF